MTDWVAEVDQMVRSMKDMAKIVAELPRGAGGRGIES